ncbi:Uncharacterised protein [Mammaliicoccus fleurettii]|nr:Uncharacterised protein [Mammaliicoccus fleurettii]
MLFQLLIDFKIENISIYIHKIDLFEKSQLIISKSNSFLIMIVILFNSLTKVLKIIFKI